MYNFQNHNKFNKIKPIKVLIKINFKLNVLCRKSKTDILPL